MLIGRWVNGPHYNEWPDGGFLPYLTGNETRDGFDINLARAFGKRYPRVVHVLNVRALVGC